MNEISTFPENYVIFDLETTGFTRQRDKIIEIAAIKVCNGEVADTFSSLVNPQEHIKEEIVSVTHIDDEMVKDAPVIKDALPKFLEFIGNDVLIGHNIQVFDLKFVEREAKAIDRKIENDFIDTLHMAKKASLKGERFKKTSLEAIAEHYGISTEGNHRAMKDCEINLEIYKRFKELLKKNSKTEIVGEDAVEEEKTLYLYITGPKWVKYDHFKEKVLFFTSENKKVVIVTDNVGTVGGHISRMCKETGFERVIIRGDWLHGDICKAREKRDNEIMTFLKEQAHNGILTFWDIKTDEARYLYTLSKKHGIPMKATK